jgi:hypothetical protein
MAKLITDCALLDTLSKLPLEIQRNSSQRSFWLAVAVLKYFFNAEWVERYIGVGQKEPSFLRLTATDKDEIQSQISAFRIVDLAEILLNLQGIPGLEICLERMRREQIEATYAELDFGRMLYLSGINFRYVRPQQTKGRDYDIEIVLADGRVVCADAKCKIDTTEFSERTVSNSLQEARKQFPENRPSMIFLKVPARWLRQDQIWKSLVDIAMSFFQTTGRIVSVKFYISEATYKNGMIKYDQMFREVSNPLNRFAKNRNWDLFAEPNPKGGWSTVPVRWKRLLFFPSDGPL